MRGFDLVEKSLKNRKNAAVNFFYIVFGAWYTMDIIMRTALLDKINAFASVLFGVNDLNINPYVDRIVLALLAIKIVFLQRYTFREIVIIAISGSIIVVSTLGSGSHYLVAVFIFIVAAKNVEMDQIINVAYKVLLIVIPLTIILCIVGVIPDYITSRYGIIRHSLGFEHPNRLGMRVFQLLACHCYLRRNKDKNFLTYIILIGCAYFVYKVPNSQTGYISIILLLFVFLLWNIVKKNNIYYQRIMNTFVIASAVVNFGTVYLNFHNPRDYKLYNAIDLFMSKRFYWCHKMYEYYGVSLWGQKISTIVQDDMYVGIFHQWYLDNAFFSLLLCFGIAAYCLFSLGYMLTIIRYSKSNNFMMVGILFLYSVYGIMTTGFYMMSHNIFLITMVVALYSDAVETKHTRRRIRFVLPQFVNVRS